MEPSLYSVSFSPESNEGVKSGVLANIRHAITNTPDFTPSLLSGEKLTEYRDGSIDLYENAQPDVPSHEQLSLHRMFPSGRAPPHRSHMPQHNQHAQETVTARTPRAPHHRSASTAHSSLHS